MKSSIDFIPLNSFCITSRNSLNSKLEKKHRDVGHHAEVKAVTVSFKHDYPFLFDPCVENTSVSYLGRIKSEISGFVLFKFFIS